MPFASGIYTGTSNTFNNAVNGTIIDPADWNELFTDIELGLNDLSAGRVYAPTSVVSAATCDIGATNTSRIVVTGSTGPITSLGTSANRLRFVSFTGTPTLTHNATTLILPGGADIVVAAGDCSLFSSDASGNWRCLIYSATALAGNDFLVKTASATLSAERVVTNTATIEVDWATAGQAKFNIVDDSISDAKLRNSAAVSVIGRSANSAGDPADIAASANDTLLRRVSDAVGFGALTLGMAAANLWTYAKLQQGTALSVLGVTGNATANLADIAAATDNQVMRRSGTAIAFGAVNLASSDAVTGDLPLANLTQGSALSVLGVAGNATADHASIVAANDGEILRRAGTSIGFGSVSATAVNFTQAGTGAEERTAQSKLRESWISITDFGAVGDGTTNNQAAITAAIAASAGRWLYVPVDASGGDYAITSGTLTIPSTCTIVYEGGARVYADGGTISDSGCSYSFGGGDAGESGRSRVTRGFDVNILGGNSGSPAVGQIDFNRIFIDADFFDGTAGGGSKVNGFSVRHEFGDSATKGARRAIAAELFQELATSTTNTDRNYCALLGHVRSSTGDGGVLTPGQGAYFGLSGYSQLLSGATGTQNVTGAEFNSLIETGASSFYRSGIQIAGGGSVRGSEVDAALSISNLGSISARWKTGILFGAQNGSPAFDTDSRVIEIEDNLTLDYLIKATGVTFTTGLLVAEGVNWTPSLFALTGAQITASRAGISASLINTTDAATNIALELQSDRATPAANDRVGISFKLSDSAGNQDELGRVEVLASAVTSGAEISQMRLHVATGGVLSVEAILTAGAFSPGTDGGNTLGITNVGWNGLHLFAGSAINWSNGDVLATHSTNALAFTGASSGYSFDALLTASVAGNPANFINTTDSALVQVLRLEGDRATPADGDTIYQSFYLSDDAGTQTEFVRLSARAIDASNTTEDGDLTFGVLVAGVLTNKLLLENASLRPSTNGGLSLGDATRGYSGLSLSTAASTVGTGAKTISNAADSSTNFGKYFSIILNGVTVYVPCGTVAPT